MRINRFLALSAGATVLIPIATRAAEVNTENLQQAFPYIARNFGAGNSVSMPPGMSMAPRFYGHFDPSKTNALLGSGFDSIASTIRAQCVERLDTLVTILPQKRNSNGQDVRYDGKEITSLSQLRRLLNISASASFSYGIYSGNGNFSLFEDEKFNAFSSYMYLSVEVTNMTEVLPQKNLVDSKVEQFKTDKEGFRRSCGDNYVSAITTGGVFNAVVKFDSKTQEHQRAVSAAINGAIGGFGQASGSMDERFSSLESLASFSIVLVRKGDQAAIPNLTNLHQYALDFPNKVAPEASPWVFNAITSDYDTVDNLPAGRTADDYASQEVFLEGLATLRDLALQTRNNLTYVVAKPDEFESHDQQRVQADLSAATQKVQEILKLANDCKIAPLTKCTGNYPELGSFTVPKRATSGATAKINQAEELFAKRGIPANADAALVILSTIDETVATPEERYHAALLTAEALEWQAARFGIVMVYDSDKIPAYRVALNKAVGLAAALPSRPCEADFLAATEEVLTGSGAKTKQIYENARDKMAALRSRSTRTGEICTKYLWAGIDRWTAYAKGSIAGLPTPTKPTSDPALWQEATKAAEEAFNKEPDHPGNVYLWAIMHQDYPTYCGILKAYFERPIPDSFKGLKNVISRIKAGMSDRSQGFSIYRDCPK